MEPHAESIQSSRRGRVFARTLRDEDWKFGGLFAESHETLIAACWYEYARESPHVYLTMRRWLCLQQLSQRLLPLMEAICKEMADGKHQFMTGEQQKLPVTIENYRWWARKLMLEWAFRRQDSLPRPLCKAFVKMHDAEEAVQRIESRAGAGAPRLRTLAQHLIADTPWLLIPAADRENAIELRFQDRFDLPNTSGQPMTKSGGNTYFGNVFAFEQVPWNDFPQPSFSDEDLRNNRDLYHREIVLDAEEEQKRLEGIVPGVRVLDGFVWDIEIRTGVDEETARRVAAQRVGQEFVPARIRWTFSDREILEDIKTWLKDHRPNKWRHLAKNSGRGPTEKRWWIAVLKELAAMRLCAHRSQDHALMAFNDEAFGAAKPIDQARLGQLRRNAEKTFKQFFHFTEEARSADTYSASRRKK